MLAFSTSSLNMVALVVVLCSRARFQVRERRATAMLSDYYDVPGLRVSFLMDPPRRSTLACTEVASGSARVRRCRNASKKHTVPALARKTEKLPEVLPDQREATGA